MSIVRLLTQPITIHHRGVTGVDDHGNPVEGDESTQDAFGFISAQPTGQDTTADGLSTTSIQTAVLVVDGTTTVVADGDQVEDEDGNVWVVDGTPVKSWNPRLGKSHHLEAKLTIAS